MSEWPDKKRYRRASKVFSMNTERAWYSENSAFRIGHSNRQPYGD